MNYSAHATGTAGRPQPRRDWRAALVPAVGLAALAAILAAGFAAYLNPSLLLALENLRLCF
ncbi:MAG: hypothetical protein N2544_03585 [Burkholderiales bacterium]|nr:hypothetical protein [Burkholderiales bacterium]